MGVEQDIQKRRTPVSHSLPPSSVHVVGDEGVRRQGLHAQALTAGSVHWITLTVHQSGHTVMNIQKHPHAASLRAERDPSQPTPVSASGTELLYAIRGINQGLILEV